MSLACTEEPHQLAKSHHVQMSPYIPCHVGLLPDVPGKLMAGNVLVDIHLGISPAIQLGEVVASLWFIPGADLT